MITGVSCGEPSSPPNGDLYLDQSMYMFGDSLTVQCRQGYLPRGDLSTTCSVDGSWTPILGQCSSKLILNLLYSFKMIFLQLYFVAKSSF